MRRPETSVLFVSREDASRGLLAEATLRHLGKTKFKVFSCGAPDLSVGPPKEWALLALQTAGIPATGLRSKGWDEFTRSGAPRMDIVIALDEATMPRHPSWPGQPETALWAFDPLVKTKGNEVGIATLRTLHSLRRRIELLISLNARADNVFDLRHDLRDMAHL